MHITMRIVYCSAASMTKGSNNNIAEEIHKTADCNGSWSSLEINYATALEILLLLF